MVHYDPKTITDNTIKDNTGNLNTGIIGGAGYFHADGVVYGKIDAGAVHDGTKIALYDTFRWGGTSSRFLWSKRLEATNDELEFFIQLRLPTLVHCNFSEDGTILHQVDFTVPTLDDGEIHDLCIEFDSGTVTCILDGVTQTGTVPITTLYIGTAPLWCFSYGAGSPYIGDLMSFKLQSNTKDIEFFTSSSWQNILFSECGDHYATLTGATYLTDWLKDTVSDVYPRNFDKGFKRFTNGTPAEDVLYPLTVPTEPVTISFDGFISSTNTEKWTIRYKKFTGAESARVMFMSAEAYLGNGYCVYSRGDLNTIALEKFTGGVPTVIASGSIPSGSDFEIVITRSVAGEFEITVDEVVEISATDTDHATSIYMVFRTYNDPSYMSYVLDQNDDEYILSKTQYLLPAGYSLKAVVPAQVFGDWEGWFYVPYAADIAAKDINHVLYTGTTPNKIYYSTLDTTDFGPEILYDPVLDSEGYPYYVRFRVKK